jgi:hypothetical protein
MNRVHMLYCQHPQVARVVSLAVHLNASVRHDVASALPPPTPPQSHLAYLQSRTYQKIQK